jgi:hypothetical protein
MLVALVLSLQVAVGPQPAPVPAVAASPHADTLTAMQLAVTPAAPDSIPDRPASIDPLPAPGADDDGWTPALRLAPVTEPLVARPMPTLARATLPAVGAGRIGATRPADTTLRTLTVPPAVEYSDWYYRRLALHRALSWAMVPLFIGSYITGDQLLDGDASDFSRRAHPFFAGGSAVLFGANLVTGTWNLVDSWKVKEGRTTRVLHSIAMVVASAGFVYAGSLGDQARDDRDIRNRHRTVALSSMGISTASWLFMLFKN